MGGRRLPYEEYHKVIDNIEYKKCLDCPDGLEWHEMNSDNFYKNKATQDGFNTWCKQCSIKRSSKRNNENKEDYIAYLKVYNKNYFSITDNKMKQREKSNKRRVEGKHKEWQKNNPDKIKGYTLKRNMNKKHDITNEEWFACLDYFNNSCAYCGLTVQEQFKLYNENLHMEHVYHNGSNYIDNCVPSCTKCNVNKFTFEFNKWYNENNDVFSKRRYNKIVKWMTKECFKALNLL